FQVVELLDETTKVSGAVPVGVLETPDEDLIEHRPLVPGRVVRDEVLSHRLRCWGCVDHVSLTEGDVGRTKSPGAPAFILVVTAPRGDRHPCELHALGGGPDL